MVFDDLKFPLILRLPSESSPVLIVLPLKLYFFSSSFSGDACIAFPCSLSLSCLPLSRIVSFVFALSSFCLSLFIFFLLFTSYLLPTVVFLFISCVFSLYSFCLSIISCVITTTITPITHYHAPPPKLKFSLNEEFPFQPFIGVSDSPLGHRAIIVASTESIASSSASTSQPTPQLTLTVESLFQPFIRVSDSPLDHNPITLACIKSIASSSDCTSSSPLFYLFPYSSPPLPHFFPTSIYRG